MEQSPSWKAKWVSGNQETPHILWNPKVHYRICISLPPCHYSEPDQSSQCPPSHFLEIHFNINLPSMPGSSKWSLSLRFPYQNPVYASSLPIPTKCPAHLILVLITRTVMGEQYISLSSSLCSVLQSLVTLSLLGQNVLNTLFFNTLSLRSSLNVSDHVSHPYKTRGKIIFLCILIFKFLIANWKAKDSSCINGFVNSNSVTGSLIEGAWE